MKKTPLISVIVPVYNTEKYLSPCVDSVLNQTYQQLEIILVDDGSTDSSGTICDDYSAKEKRIITIHKQNGGQSSARNAALDIAKGEYVYFLDSDDYIGKNLLRDLVSTAERNKSDFVFFEAEAFFDDERNELNRGIQKNFEYSRKQTYGKCKGQEQYLRLRNHEEYYVCVPLHFYRKAYLDDNGIRFQEGIIHEDNLFSAEVYLRDGIAVHMPCRFYYRRLRTQSTMTSQDREQLAFKFNSLVKVYYSISKSIKEIKPDREMVRLLMTDSFDSVMYAYQNLKEEQQVQYRSLYKKLKRHCFVHYGRYDYQLARKCSGTILRPLVRGIHVFVHW